jgi:hypothetical protein
MPEIAASLGRRLEHQEPTSDEVGMRQKEGRVWAVGLNIKDPTSYEVGMRQPDKQAILSLRLTFLCVQKYLLVTNFLWGQKE